MKNQPSWKARRGGICAQNLALKGIANFEVILLWRRHREAAGEGAARPPRPRGKVRDHCSSSEPRRRRRRRKLFSNFLFSPFRQSSAIRGAKLVLQCSQWPKLCLHFFSMQPTPAADAAPWCPSFGPGVVLGT